MPMMFPIAWLSDLRIIELICQLLRFWIILLSIWAQLELIGAISFQKTSTKLLLKKLTSPKLLLSKLTSSIRLIKWPRMRWKTQSSEKKPSNKFFWIILSRPLDRRLFVVTRPRSSRLLDLIRTFKMFNKSMFTLNRETNNIKIPSDTSKFTYSPS